MIRRVLTVSTLTVTALAAAWSAEPALYMRQPTLSPDNRFIAFAYRGDIWKVDTDGGRAERLTVHPGRDQRPVWSPDGMQIAFASDREGQSDVYVMPATGGAPRRLTFNTGNDYPCDWSPNGEHVLIETYRLWRPDLEEVPLAGGPARPVTGVYMEGEYTGRYSRDGKQIVLCDGIGYATWWWQAYKGGRAGQVWVLKRGSWPPEVERVSPEGTQFLWPGWAGRDVISTSNTTDAVNIVRFKDAKGDPVPVTMFPDGGVSWLSVSRDGSCGVFERNFRMWYIDFATDSVREVTVEAPSDWVAPPRVEASIDAKIEEFCLSPDGRRIALVAGGELYLIPSEKPERARRLTSTDARERFCTFSPDGKQVAYVSDRDLRQNLYLVDTRSGDETALTNFKDVDAAKPQFSPDGDRIAFYLANDRIVSVATGGGPIDTILLGRYFDFPLESTQEFAFSPDGRFLAYTAFGTDYNTDIWVYAFDRKTNANMTRRSQYNYDPRWSPDGKYLTFTHAHREDRDLYALRLVPEGPEFAEAKLDSLYDKPAKKSDKDEAKDSLPQVKIDFDRAHMRWEQVYPLASEQAELVQSPDGKYWLFLADLPGGTNIWRVPVDPDSDDKPLQLTNGRKDKSRIAVDSESKWVYYLEDGRIGRVGIDGKEQKLLSFSADYDYHPAQRDAQKLGEVWRVLGNYFYDPDMHGADWDSLRQAYAAVLPHIALTDELHELFKGFIGRLNSSHLNIYGGDPALPSARQSGYLGADLDPRALRRGVYRLASVHAGGPLDETQAEVNEGDTLVAVNGDTLTARTNLDSLLAGTIGERLRLSLRGRNGAYTAEVKPVSKGQASTLAYEHWVASRRKLVDSLSQGRLGYLHLRAMNQPALDRFQQELTDQTANYEGIVIDVRYNGGGWISVHLLGMLERRPFVLRNFRGAETVSENKNRTFAVEKPGILLVNHYSASNSEIFAEGWRHLGLGKIVGYPTAAAVIGTSEYPLIDGSACRRPSWGAWTVEMENLEGNPRRPDIQIFNTQSDWISGRDPQLERAVEELLTELR